MFIFSRAGLTIGQTGQMLGASRFCGSSACLSKRSFAGFSCFKLFSMRQNCRSFWLLRLVYRLRKPRNLPFNVFEWLEKNRTTQYHTLWPNNKIEISASMGVRKNLSREGNIFKLLLSLYRLLTMQWKWTFTKRWTLSSLIVCAGWTAILNLLSEMFSRLRLSEMFFLTINCLLSIFREFFQISYIVIQE